MIKKKTITGICVVILLLSVGGSQAMIDLTGTQEGFSGKYTDLDFAGTTGLSDCIDNLSAGGGNPFNQDLNTTDSPTFDDLHLSDDLWCDVAYLRTIGMNSSLYHRDDADTFMHYNNDEIYFSVGGIKVLKMLPLMATFSSNVTVDYNVTASHFIGNGSQLTALAPSWNNITDMPAGFADDVDNVSGSNLFNQSLNTTDNVVFNTINITGTSNRPNTQYHNTSTIDTIVADKWVNVTWDMQVSSEATWGFSLGPKKQNITVEFVGIVRVQGCMHPKYSGASSNIVNMYTRVLINGTEARCLQTAWSKEFKANQMSTLYFIGTVNTTLNSKIQIQYRVNSTNIDFEGANVFDNPVSASLNLERID